MTIDQAEGEIGAFLAKFPFAVDPKVLERLEGGRSAPIARASASSLAYSTEQEVAMLVEFTRRMRPILERRGEEVRSRPPLVLDGIAADWVADAIRDDRIQAEVCRLVALSGTSARVRASDRGALHESKFDNEEIDEINRLAQRHALDEAGSDGSIGPDRDVLVFHLQQVGALATVENIARLRRASLHVLAELLHAHARRYRSAPDHLAGIVASASRVDPPSTDASTSSVALHPVMHDEMAVASVQPKVEGFPRASRPSTMSFVGMVERLVRSKTAEKTREWRDKTGEQHLSIARLFVKHSGTDDPALLSQRHIGSYLDLLRTIPTSYGKSSADEGRTIEQILARSEDLDDDEIGLAAGTINRHRTQLGAILKYMKVNGVPIGVIDEDTYVKDAETPESKRRSFTIDDGVQLMSTLDTRSRLRIDVDPDALFGCRC